MTATVKDFCRINGISENSDNLVDIIYNSSGERNSCPFRDAGQENQSHIGGVRN